MAGGPLRNYRLISSKVSLFCSKYHQRSQQLWPQKCKLVDQFPVSHIKHSHAPHQPTPPPPPKQKLKGNPSSVWAW